MFFKNTLVLIKGAGGLASGIAYRLKRVGFPVVMTEQKRPTLVRRAVSFGEVIYSRETMVEGLLARHVESSAEARQLANSDIIPVLIDPDAKTRLTLNPIVVIDAIMAKTNTGTTINNARLVIALGPGFTAEEDCHVVVETSRGHWMGRIIYEGQAEPDVDFDELGNSPIERTLYAPTGGHVVPVAQIGDRLEQEQLIAVVNGQPIIAPFSGVLRGLIHPEVEVATGMKIGNLDPRGMVRHCFTISDRALAVGGGVLEAILASGAVHL
jgi:xanthine dehydrogenase accessory factor